MSKESVRGKALTIHFDGGKCIHARNCVMSAPAVFKANVTGPWIDPDAAAAEELAAVAKNCPSGAITYERHDGGASEIAPPVNTIRVRENGPLAVHAELHIDGQPPCHRATLCRCGHSANKPFCDGAHAGKSFIATGEPPATAETELPPQRDGVLSVKPAANGPLLVNGNCELVSGTGRVIQRSGKMALCRCGASKNKPFCDGSHKAIGFTA